MKHMVIAIFAAFFLFAVGGIVAWYAPVVLMAVGLVLLAFIVISMMRKRRLHRVGVALSVVAGLMLGLVSTQVVEARRTIQPPSCQANPLACR